MGFDANGAMPSQVQGATDVFGDLSASSER